jgi:glycosyltransferase involved in cell wall biosynthesis
MRILVITNMYPSAEWPTSGVFIRQQIEGLMEIGLEVRVVFVERLKRGPWVYYRLGPAIRRAIEEFTPGVVHVMYGGVMADQVTRERGLPPVVLTFHGSDLLGENFSGLFRKLMSHYGVFCSRRAAGRAQGVVVVARHLIRALGKAVSPDRINVIPCGVNLDHFKPLDQGVCQSRLGWERGPLHVLFADNNGDPVKRPGLALAAVRSLESIGTPACLHLLSSVPYAEVPVWMGASDVLVLTSLQEGSPTVVKEALACGLPVVSLDVGDVAGQLAGLEGCCLAEAEPRDLALKLQRVFEHRQRIDCRARLEKLSHIAVARRLRDFYQEVLLAGPRITRQRGSVSDHYRFRIENSRLPNFNHSGTGFLQSQQQNGVHKDHPARY